MISTDGKAGARMFFSPAWADNNILKELPPLPRKVLREKIPNLQPRFSATLYGGEGWGGYCAKI
jgi:hypothetical protein